MKDGLSAEELKDRAAYNKNIAAEVLEHNGYDYKYLFIWGMPKLWIEEFWAYPSHVMDLMSYFEEVYKIYDSRDSLDE